MFHDPGEVALHAQGRLRKDESKPAKVLSSQGLREFSLAYAGRPADVGRISKAQKLP